MRFDRDRRTPLEQARSGLRIVGAIVATLATIWLFAVGYAMIANADHTSSPIVGWGLVIVLTATLILTVQYWSRWFFCVPGYLGMRSSIGLLLGWFSPGGFAFVCFPILMFAMFGLSFRFRKSAKPRRSDRLALLVTAACLLAATLEFLAKAPNLALLFAAIGDVVLSIAWIYSSRKSRRRATSNSEPLTLNR